MSARRLSSNGRLIVCATKLSHMVPGKSPVDTVCITFCSMCSWKTEVLSMRGYPMRLAEFGYCSLLQQFDHQHTAFAI